VDRLVRFVVYLGIKEDEIMSATLLEHPRPLPLSVDELEARILAHLNDEAVIGLDALIEMLPEYSWNQIFNAVDQLARRGKVVLRRHRYDYTLFSMSYAA
jgi:hypothetical protein